MKVKILIEFDVHSRVYTRELTEAQAKSAASEAAWQHLTFTETGANPIDAVTVHVDGYGECEVRVSPESA